MTSAARVLQLKVTLSDTKPPIWRRLLVAEDTSLAVLHEILQVAMGWQNYHLHAFKIHGQTFGRPDPEDFVPVVDERKHHVGALVYKRHRFFYEYDFGDCWTHAIAVEEVREPAAGEVLPSCLTGRRACPPEDCGGTSGYADMLNAISDPEHERHEELLVWLGGQFDAEAFDLDAINAGLAELAHTPRGRTKKRTAR